MFIVETKHYEDAKNVHRAGLYEEVVEAVLETRKPRQAVGGDTCV